FENTSVLPRFFPVRNVVIEFKRDVFVERLIRNENAWGVTAILRNLKVENDRMRYDFFLPRPPGAPEASLRMLSAGATEYEMEVDAPRYTLIVSSIPVWPGWKISRNGESAAPIEVNGAFLGFAAPPGKTRVRVWYDPWSFKLGALVSLLTVLALAAPLARSRLNRLRSAAAPAGETGDFPPQPSALPD
ncbi:MAG TPA: YfhO family protein, partial [Thermoanaerobaculia bacterium]|nr:YfhO family protein [Thermoanaerobaculia bacterium]